MDTNYRVATLGPTEEMRKMKVGETVKFPADRYNYGTLRSTPSTALFNEQCKGSEWRTKKSAEDKCIYVTRVS